MDVQVAIESLKKNINQIYNGTKEKLKPNIYRGHSRTISTDIEDETTLFIANVLPDSYKFLIDASINIDGKNNRPDLLVVDDKNHVKFMIELKANMGYCRNATHVINEMIDNHHKFSKVSILTCKFSDEEVQTVIYDYNVQLFLLSFTDGNCSLENHINNKQYADQQGIYHYNLFSGWYGELRDKEIHEFVNKLLVLE